MSLRYEACINCGVRHVPQSKAWRECTKTLFERMTVCLIDVIQQDHCYDIKLKSDELFRRVRLVFNLYCSVKEYVVFSTRQGRESPLFKFGAQRDLSRNNKTFESALISVENFMKHLRIDFYDGEGPNLGINSTQEKQWIQDVLQERIYKLPPHTAPARASSPPTSHTQTSSPTSSRGSNARRDKQAMGKKHSYVKPDKPKKRTDKHKLQSAEEFITQQTKTIAVLRRETREAKEKLQHWQYRVEDLLNEKNLVKNKLDKMEDEIEYVVGQLSSMVHNAPVHVSWRVVDDLQAGARARCKEAQRKYERSLTHLRDKQTTRERQAAAEANTLEGGNYVDAEETNNDSV